jgi:hypothetical protein
VEALAGWSADEEARRKAWRAKRQKLSAPSLPGVGPAAVVVAAAAAAAAAEVKPAAQKGAVSDTSSSESDDSEEEGSDAATAACADEGNDETTGRVGQMWLVLTALCTSRHHSFMRARSRYAIKSTIFFQ